ncbi:sigma-70 family RNA polymerase sigma factor [Algoriphagus lacus]|uniref:Sigma-70 family RNA polymerase sigma factor n=1 Tax=Algoriphagus lacus TaxID=2056311 RepID=A0A418PQD4_9BACT|nr:sigma-70 family RNA polymerase sigma factor [Algoriphagus lacus]RIW14531.1 sigma-70 family RNA polymerase sigma factor [Algoriphagus lacus]
MKLNRNLTDQEILEKIKSKSDPNQAISQLYSQHYGMLEHYIIQNSGSADDAADLIQEAMLVFVKLVSEEKYRGEASVKSFLYSICKNLWITELRRRKSTEARHERYEGEKDQLESDISAQISKNENLKFVMDLFDKLGEKCKQLLMLFYFEELPMKEIGEKLEFSSEQVLRNKKYKCLQSLTDQVKSSPALSKNLQKALRHE